MPFFDDYLKIIDTPKEAYKKHFQNVVNSLFDVTTTVHYDIEEEVSFGTLQFKQIDARVNNLVDAKTGQRVNDDFKKIIFSDNDYKPIIGTRYRFNNNIWIVFSTDNVKTDTASVYVRRCNNTLNTQDKFGNIHIEPCYVDYSPTETQIFKEYSMDIPRGRILVGCQLNEYTKNIKINDRYLLNGDAYKVRIRDRFDRRETFSTESTKYLKLQMDYDNISEEDNEELNIANFIKYNYKIGCDKKIENVSGYKGKIKPVLLNNDESVDFEYNIIYESEDNNIVSIDENGTYTLNNIGKTNIKCYLKENKDIFSYIEVSVSDKKEDEYKTEIIPKKYYILMGEEVEYTVFEYLNNNKISTEFTISAYNFNNEECVFYREKNKFIIKNLYPSTEPVKIEVKNNRNSDVINLEIVLGGLF